MSSKGRAHLVRFDAEDEAEVANYVATIGEPDSAVLARTTMRGIRAERLERALLLYIKEQDIDAAAAFAGLPRAVFLEELLHHRIHHSRWGTSRSSDRSRAPTGTHRGSRTPR